MKTKFLFPLCCIVLTLSLSPRTHAQGTAFTYAGRLNDGANPANGQYDFSFKLYLDSVGNTQAGDSYLTNGLAVSNGLFTTTIDFGAGLFTGANYWLEVAVKTNGAYGYAILSPLQALTPTPYAIFANSASNVLGAVPATQLSGFVPSANMSGTYANAVTLNNAANQFTGNGATLANVNAATLGGLSSFDFWRSTGNSGTTPGMQFLGTTDNQPLELKVNNQRGLRLEPTGSNDTVNVIGGSARNFVGAGVVGATISGGGSGNYFGVLSSNRVEADFGTVSGGRRNTIQTNARAATIGGGDQNTVQNNACGWQKLRLRTNPLILLALSAN